MLDRRTRRSVLILLALGLLVYVLQLAVFRDPRDTFFYIFQDLAFLPVSVALATIVVGGLLDERARSERLQKTRMLTSSFFTEMGTELMVALLRSSEKNVLPADELLDDLHDRRLNTQELERAAESLDFRVALDAGLHSRVSTLLESNRTMLMVVSSNPLLLEHEDFTALLWRIYHLIDEFRLRGEFSGLTHADVSHLEDDLTEALHLLVGMWATNVRYMQDEYPDFYSTARAKMELAREGREDTK